MPDTEEWANLSPSFPTYPGLRQIIVADIHMVQTSCGFAVPFMDFVGHRETLVRWADAKGPEFLTEYRSEKNAKSIDGLPAPMPIEV